MTVPFSQLQEIAPSAIIELFQLELNLAQHGVNETYYFHAGVNTLNNGDIVWNGQAYMAFPIEATEFEYTGTGSLPRPKLRVSNIMGTITAMILTLPNGIEGAKVTRIRTLARYIDAANYPPDGELLLEDGDTLLLEDVDSFLLEAINSTEDPTAEFPREIYYIDRKAGENRDTIEFELAAAFDLVGVRAPKRQCVSNVCQWTYRAPECGYAGNAYFNFNDQPVTQLSQDICGKRLRSCELRFAQQRFAGSVTAGNNVITLGQAVSFSTGDPVAGFGLPAGTTVSSVNSNLVTVSQNATATTAVTSTGTIASNFTQIVLSSAAGIAPGMFAYGAYLPANVQVVAVAGNTVTLSAPVDRSQFFTVLGTFVGSVNRNSIQTDPATVVNVGEIIGSFLFPLESRTVVTEIRYFWVTIGKGSSRRKVVVTSQSASTGGAQTITRYAENPIPSASYTFSATDTNYTFRAASNLPYGSFPGVGTFSA